MPISPGGPWSFYMTSSLGITKKYSSISSLWDIDTVLFPQMCRTLGQKRAGRASSRAARALLKTVWPGNEAVNSWTTYIVRRTSTMLVRYTRRRKQTQKEQSTDCWRCCDSIESWAFVVICFQKRVYLLFVIIHTLGYLSTHYSKLLGNNK